MIAPALNSVLAPIWFATVIIWMAGEGYLVIRDRKTPVDYDRRSRRLIYSSITIGMILATVAGSMTMFRFHSDPDLIAGISIMLIWIGMAIRYLAILTLGRFFSTLIQIQDNHQIVRAGLYRYIRHPTYLGSLISTAGIILIFQNYLIPFIILGALIPAVVIRIQYEETALCEHTGRDYQQYMAETWRLIPFIW